MNPMTAALHPATGIFIAFVAVALLYLLVAVALAWREVRRATRDYERYAAEYSELTRRDPYRVTRSDGDLPEQAAG